MYIKLRELLFMGEIPAVLRPHREARWGKGGILASVDVPKSGSWPDKGLTMRKCIK